MNAIGSDNADLNLRADLNRSAQLPRLNQPVRDVAKSVGEAVNLAPRTASGAVAESPGRAITLAGSQAAQTAHTSQNDAVRISSCEGLVIQGWMGMVRQQFASMGVYPPPASYAGVRLQSIQGAAKGRGYFPEQTVTPKQKFQLLFLRKVLRRVTNYPPRIFGGEQALPLAEAMPSPEQLQSMTAGGSMAWGLEATVPDQPPQTTGGTSVAVPMTAITSDFQQVPVEAGVYVSDALPAAKSLVAALEESQGMALEYPGSAWQLEGMDLDMALTDSPVEEQVRLVASASGLGGQAQDDPFEALNPADPVDVAAGRLQEPWSRSYHKVYDRLQVWSNPSRGGRLLALGQEGLGVLEMDYRVEEGGDSIAQPARQRAALAYSTAGQFRAAAGAFNQYV